MKISQNQVLFMALGALVAIVVIKNVTGKKDKAINYGSNPSF